MNRRSKKVSEYVGYNNYLMIRTTFPSSGGLSKIQRIFDGAVKTQTFPIEKPWKHLCQEVFKNNLKKWIKGFPQLQKSYSEYNQELPFQALIYSELRKVPLLLIHSLHFCPLQYQSQNHLPLKLYELQ